MLALESPIVSEHMPECSSDERPSAGSGQPRDLALAGVPMRAGSETGAATSAAPLTAAILDRLAMRAIPHRHHRSELGQHVAKSRAAGCAAT